MSVVSVQHHQMFIDGRDVDSDAVYEIRSPATEELVCTMAKGSVEHADLAVDAARRAFERGVWARNGAGGPLRRSCAASPTASAASSRTSSRPRSAPTARRCARRRASTSASPSPHFLHFAEQAATYAFERDVVTTAYPTHSTNRIRREPIGVCAAIVPWNFPLVLGIWKIGAGARGRQLDRRQGRREDAAVAAAPRAGRPRGGRARRACSTSSPATAPEVGARLASHPGVDKVAFTGSTAVGREIMRLASGTVKKVSLELGGKAPVDRARRRRPRRRGRRRAVRLHALQRARSASPAPACSSPQALHDEIVERLVARASTIKLGDPATSTPTWGRSSPPRQRDRILGLLEAGRAEGATFALGGGVPEGAGVRARATGSSRRSSPA